MKNALYKKFKLGPATLVAAAFIGPGTVTICTLAGVNYGFELLWALVFSIIATVVIQEMSARIGIIGQMGLGEALRKHLNHPFLKGLSMFLVLSAILVGNAAYEAGNISGGILGLHYFVDTDIPVLAILMGLIAVGLLYHGNSVLIERTLIALVLIMSTCFVITAVATRPNIGEVVTGMLYPRIDWNNILFVTGLVGTTVVPYNLFLHASLAKNKWNENQIGDMRFDNYVSIILGGLVSMAIVIAASSLQGQDITDAAQMGISLEPILGKYSGIMIAIGLFAAGLTSSITAPLAAAYATRGIMGWKDNERDNKFRMVWAVIILIGVVFSSLGIRPIEIIKFAQITNGILLPLVVIFLIYLINKKTLMGNYTNNRWQNMLGMIILIICIGLSLRTMIRIFG